MNNFEILRPLFDFKKFDPKVWEILDLIKPLDHNLWAKLNQTAERAEKTFYVVQVIQRGKDNLELFGGSSGRVRIVRTYKIKSLEDLDRYREEIIKLCEMFNARACFWVNRRNTETTSQHIIKKGVEFLTEGKINQIQNLWFNEINSYKSDGQKKWLLDIDDPRFNRIVFLRQLEQIRPYGNKEIITVPSPNGMHIITIPFDLKAIEKLLKENEIELHKNVYTNLYVPEKIYK